jgi:hypothetical protein
LKPDGSANPLVRAIRSFALTGWRRGGTGTNTENWTWSEHREVGSADRSGFGVFVVFSDSADLAVWR